VDGADWLRSQLATVACADCGRTYGAGRIRILAQREELFFVDLACRCGREAIAIVTISLDDDRTPSLDLGDLEDEEAFGPPPAAAVDSDDVLDMHLFLRSFDGDFRSLFSASADAR
jgi:hypothetical protein